ncbi:MAG: PQQ-dependent sugar dehydrogenase [Dehalococcoidia bacterium]
MSGAWGSGGKRILMASLLCLLLAAACQGGGSPPMPLVVPAAAPISLAFAPDGRVFYTELQGNVRVLTPDGQILEQPFATVEAVHGQENPESGLIGLALDPDFESNHYVYIYYVAQLSRSQAQPIILRYTDQDSVGVSPTPIIDDLPKLDASHVFHIAGNLHFGPDGYLYVSIGNYDEDESAQDLSTPKGKILRVNKEDGSAPADNPFVGEPGADPRIFAYGFRNPFDFTIDPKSGQLYATENGPDRCDVLFLIVKGANYGWPDPWAPNSCTVPGSPEPLYLFTRDPELKPWDPFSTVAPAGIQFVSPDLNEDLANSLLVCEYIGGKMRRLQLGGDNLDKIVSDTILVQEGCGIDVSIDREGTIWYTNHSEIRRLVLQ